MVHVAPLERVSAVTWIVELDTASVPVLEVV
jgi:hypothetical protein